MIAEDLGREIVPPAAPASDPPRAIAEVLSAGAEGLPAVPPSRKHHTPQVYNFPTRKLVEKDVHGGLFKETMALVERCAGFLDGKGREVFKAASVRGRLAYTRDTMLLTTRMVHAASVMVLARDWLADRVADDEAAERLARIDIATNRWWDADACPAELESLCVIAEALLCRVKGAGERLGRAIGEGRLA